MPNPEFMIDDVISADPWWGGVSSKNVRDWLAANASAKEVTVRLNSPGGDAFEGVAIYNALKRHGARVIVEVEGLAASAASVAAMAGDEIRVHQGAQLMIHEAQTVAYGPASEFNKAADRLRKINSEVADVYAARTGQTRAKVLDLMAAETWMGATEAKSLGFATSVLPAKAKPLDSSVKNHAQVSAVLSSYRNAPAALRGTVLNQHGAMPLAALATLGANGEPTWRGMTYAQLQPLEKAQLKRENASLFERMRNGPPVVSESAPADSEVTWHGKHYCELTGPQKAELQRADPERGAMMKRWPSPAKAYAELTGTQKVQLKDADPALFERMRNGSKETFRVRVG